MNQRLLLCAASALALSSAPAAAADMPYYRASGGHYAPPALVGWTGFYAGVNVGGTWSISPFVQPSQSVGMRPGASLLDYRIAAVAATTASARLDAQNNGFVGGAQVGYDWQAGSGAVLGVEADAMGFSNVKARAESALVADVPGGGGFRIGAFTTGSRSLNFLGTLRLRVGWLALPTLLVYATGGLAYGKISGDYGVTQAYFPPAAAPYALAAWAGQGAYRKLDAGWTLGFGAEWMIFPGVSIKGEYLYYALGSVQTPAAIQADPTSLPAFGAAWRNAARSYASYNGQIFRVGLNMRFSEYVPLAAPVGGPIYARY